MWHGLVLLFWSLFPLLLLSAPKNLHPTLVFGAPFRCACTQNQSTTLDIKGSLPVSVTLNVSMITHCARLKWFYWMPAEWWYEQQFEPVGHLTLILRHAIAFSIRMRHSFTIVVTKGRSVTKKSSSSCIRVYLFYFPRFFVFFCIFWLSMTFPTFFWLDTFVAYKRKYAKVKEKWSTPEKETKTSLKY